MAAITFTTKECTVIEHIDLDQWDLSKPIAKAALFHEIMLIIDRTYKYESYYEKEDKDCDN